MNETILNGSFCYNGEKITVSEGKKILADGLTVYYDCTNYENNAHFALLRFENRGNNNSEQITDINTLDIFLPCKNKAYYHSLKGDDSGSTSFMPLGFTIENDYREEPLGGRSSDVTGFPFFDINLGDVTWTFGIGWSGQWVKEIKPCDGGIILKIGVSDCDFYLYPNEKVRAASVLAVKGKTAAESRRNFRRIMREYFSPKSRLGDSFKLPVACMSFDRFHRTEEYKKHFDSWATEEGQKDNINRAEKLKYIDTYWMDAAWADTKHPLSASNYRIGKGYPNGLKSVSDYAHSKNMKYLQWFEPERVCVNSDFFDDEERVLSVEGDDWRVFNLADEKSRNWLADKLISMISEIGIDIYRNDFNKRPINEWYANDGENRRGITHLKYIEGLYILWDKINGTFPDIIIDNCAGGGRRIDLETCKRSVVLWRSDTGCYPKSKEKRITVWNNNQILTLSEYLPYHSSGVWEAKAYDVRSAATHGIACNFDFFKNDFDYESAHKALKEVLNLRDYWNGDFYPLTSPSLSEEVWSAYQLALPDSGVIYAFRRSKSEDSEKIFKINGIEKKSQYEVTVTDEGYNKEKFTVSGKALIEGFVINIPNPRNSAVMVYKKGVLA